MMNKDARINRLIESFQNKGWKVIGSVDVSHDWWFEDVIVLQSIWRPVDTRLYLTLITDPAEIKRKDVWSVSISTVLPKYRDYNSLAQITLNDIKRTDLGNLVMEVNKKSLV